MNTPLSIDSGTRLAIDPGKNGGLAWITEGEVKAERMPRLPRDLTALLKTINPKDTIIEKVGGYIGEEEKATGWKMFQFGYVAGAPYWILLTLGKRVRFVTPQKWQKALSVGTRATYGQAWKNHLKTLASDLYPSITVSLSIADALLMLEAMNRRLI
jgi:hypothetical protein